MVGMFFTVKKGVGESHGVLGHVFPIEEPDLLSQLMGALQDPQTQEKIHALQRTMVSLTRQRLHRPPPVPGVQTTQRPRTWVHDPSLTLQAPLRDAQGQVFYPAGFSWNPLTVQPLELQLLFLNGEDERQVAWAKTQAQRQPSLWILVDGSPGDLEQRLHEEAALAHPPVYFDQGGALTRRLAITQVPALVVQEGLGLRIEEHVP